MNNPIDAMHFYTKLFTGMILLMNIGLLVAIRLGLKCAKQNAELDHSERGTLRWNASRRWLIALTVLVVVMNAAAVYSNHRVVKATREIALNYDGALDSDIALTLAR